MCDTSTRREARDFYQTKLIHKRARSEEKGVSIDFNYILYKKERKNSFLFNVQRLSQRFNFIKVVQRLEFHIPEKDVALDKVRKESLGLI